MRLFRDIWQGIISLVRWLPIIWNDRQWDQMYLFKILRVKFGLMEEFFNKDAINVEAQKLGAEIKNCCDILDHLLEDPYFEMAFNSHNKKWGDLAIVENDNGIIKLERANVKTDKDKKLESKEFLKCCEKEDELINNDINLLFDTIKNRVQYWWD